MREEHGSLKERLAGEMRAAMKERDAVRLGALRLLTAAVKNREVELRHPLSDEEFIEVATREVKRRREAIEAYEKAGREDRASTEREEQRVLESYLPAALSEEDLGALIDEGLEATGASGPGDLGKVMGFVMGKAKGRVDGKAVQARVRERLNQKV
ncbi:MAG: GatB/YqeY domain-containing protein [Actinomycetota bacterium]|nr:GatB/YqeY domain-containing protein [Actinomycetota bacterium]